MARPGAFKSEKRKKELNRLKKQEEKRQKRVKKDVRDSRALMARKAAILKLQALKNRAHQNQLRNNKSGLFCHVPSLQLPTSPVDMVI